MAIASETRANGTAEAHGAPATAKRGFPGLRCPLCGHDGIQSLDLDDLATFRCQECGDEYTAADVRELLSAWGRVLDWIETAPQ